MRSKSFALVVLSSLVSVHLLAADGPAKKKAAGPAGTATLVAAEELKWVPVPDTPAFVAVVKGDPKKPGPLVQFMKLPGGFSAPLHSHTADHHVAVVSGTVTLAPEGGEAKKLGPGSWFEFNGKEKHTTTCEAGADCVLYVVLKGPFDLVPGDAPKKPDEKKK